jgi:hypothetical protein
MDVRRVNALTRDEASLQLGTFVPRTNTCGGSKSCVIRLRVSRALLNYTWTGKIPGLLSRRRVCVQCGTYISLSLYLSLSLSLPALKLGSSGMIRPWIIKVQLSCEVHVLSGNIALFKNARAMLGTFIACLALLPRHQFFFPSISSFFVFISQLSLHTLCTRNI